MLLYGTTALEELWPPCNSILVTLISTRGRVIIIFDIIIIIIISSSSSSSINSIIW